MLINKLSYYKIKFKHNNSFFIKPSAFQYYLTYKNIFDFLLTNKELSNSIDDLKIGFRQLHAIEEGILELFLLTNKPKAILEGLKQNSTVKVISIEQIDVELVKEGVLRGTLLPFNKKRNELYEGRILNLKDYIRDPFKKENNLKEQTRPFIQISKQLTQITGKNLYKPINIVELQSKSIDFEEYEIIYIHNWAET